MKRLRLPLTLLPLVPVLSTFIESLLGLLVLIGVVVVTTHTLHITLALMPIIWLTQLLLTSGLGLFVACMSVFLRDVPKTLDVFMTIWFFLTPIVYPASMIPVAIRDWAFRLNPMAAITQLYRDVVISGEVSHWGEWGIASIVSLLVFFLGLRCYQKFSPVFADSL